MFVCVSVPQGSVQCAANAYSCEAEWGNSQQVPRCPISAAEHAGTTTKHRWRWELYPLAIWSKPKLCREWASPHVCQVLFAWFYFPNLFLRHGVSGSVDWRTGESAAGERWRSGGHHNLLMTNQELPHRALRLSVIHSTNGHKAVPSLLLDRCW